jgi:hypothetical protein
MGMLRERMAVDLRLRGFSPVTQRMYLGCAQRFAAYHHQPPTALGEAEVRTFLDHLVRERRISRAALGVYVAALHFLYRVTLDRPDVVQRIRYPRRGRERLPEILSPAEVERLLGAVRSLKHRAMVMVAYGAGLRASELCALTAADIDSERMLIRVRAGKGDKDRYVMLSPRLLDTLRAYWRQRPPRPERRASGRCLRHQRSGGAQSYPGRSCAGRSTPSRACSLPFVHVAPPVGLRQLLRAVLWSASTTGAGPPNSGSRRQARGLVDAAVVHDLPGQRGAPPTPRAGLHPGQLPPHARTAGRGQAVVAKSLREKVVKIGAKAIAPAATRSSRWRRWQCRASCSAASWSGSQGYVRQTQPHADARRVHRKAAGGRAAPGVRPRVPAVRPNGARRCPGPPWRASRRQNTLACDVARAVSKPRDGDGPHPSGKCRLKSKAV